MATSSDHFAVLDGVISPQPWAQYRLVVDEQVPASTRTYGTGGTTNKHEALQAVQTHWTNNSPIDQYVYGMVSHGGSQVTLQGDTRGYIIESHGYWKGDAPPAGNGMVEVSRFGTGITRSDPTVGSVIDATNKATFAIGDVRNNSNTVPFLPATTGWTVVKPGEKFNARVETLFHTEVWDDMYGNGPQNVVRAGELSISLYAIPVIGTSTIGVRGIPTVPADGVTTVVSWDVPVKIAKPPAAKQNDVLVAIVANQFGLGSDIQPPNSTWIKKANVNGSLAGWEECHLKVFTHLVTDADTGITEYSFSNGSFAEMTIHMITLRGAEPDLDDAWAVATRYTAPQWSSHYGMVIYPVNHWAPPIAREGQLLIASSYLCHSRKQQDPVWWYPGHLLSWNWTGKSDHGHYRMGVTMRFKTDGRIVGMRFNRHPNSAVRTRQMHLYKGGTLAAVSEPTKEYAGGGWVDAKLTNPVYYKAGDVFTAVWPEPGGYFYWDGGVPTVDGSDYAEYVGSVMSGGSTGTAYPQPELQPYMRYADFEVQTVEYGTGMTQESPPGMTEVADTNGTDSTMATAVVAEDPGNTAALPNPTGDRLFVSSLPAKHTGDSITVSILVPGARSDTMKS
jgi:hypothetical protein